MSLRYLGFMGLCLSSIMRQQKLNAFTVGALDTAILILSILIFVSNISCTLHLKAKLVGNYSFYFLPTPVIKAILGLYQVITQQLLSTKVLFIQLRHRGKKRITDEANYCGENVQEECLEGFIQDPLILADVLY